MHAQFAHISEDEILITHFQFSKYKQNPELNKYSVQQLTAVQSPTWRLENLHRKVT